MYAPTIHAIRVPGHAERAEGGVRPRHHGWRRPQQRFHAARLLGRYVPLIEKVPPGQVRDVAKQHFAPEN
jgi:hypothetical protein